jgi:hypothetical protein
MDVDYGEKGSYVINDGQGTDGAGLKDIITWADQENTNKPTACCHRYPLTDGTP